MSVALRRFLVIALLVAAGAACSKPNADEHAKKAEGYLAESRVPDAILELRLALQADPKRGDLRLKLADLYVRQRELGAALGEYVRAADTLPNDAGAQVKAGGLLAAAGSFEDAKARATKALEIDPKNVEAQIILGNALAGLKKFDEALAGYQQALVLDPTQDVAYGNIGLIQGSQGKITEAEASFRKAVQVAPKSVNAHMALANFLWRIGRAPEAEKTLKTALDLDPKNLTANRALGVFYLMRNRAADAEPYFQAIARMATTSDAKIGLADYYVIVKKYPEASKILEELARTPADYAAATIRLAAIDAANSNRANAMIKLREVVEKHPKNMTARVLIARLQLGDQKIDEALKTAKAIVTEDAAVPEAPMAYTIIGSIEASRDRFDDAIKAYEEVLKRQPKSVDANIALAGLYLAMGNLDKAQGYAQQAAVLQPQNPIVRVTTARIGLARRQPKAKADLAALQKDYPNAPPVLNLVAAQQAVDRQFDQARATYQKSLQLAPGNLDALTGLSRVDLVSGRAKEAVARVESGLKTVDDGGPDARGIRRHGSRRRPAQTGHRSRAGPAPGLRHAWRAVHHAEPARRRERSVQRGDSEESEVSAGPDHARHAPRGPETHGGGRSRVQDRAQHRLARIGRRQQPRVDLCLVQPEPGRGPATRPDRASGPARRAARERHAWVDLLPEEHGIPGDSALGAQRAERPQ
jgi:tetratricopeptide (TPR) repeat protein